MNVAVYILILLATTIGRGDESSGKISFYEVASFTSQQACETAGKKATGALALGALGPRGSSHGEVRVKYVCVEKK